MIPDPNCKFCQLLASGAAAARLPNLVAETAGAIAVLNRRPAAPGHLTVILKAHADPMSTLTDETFATVGGFLGRLSAVLEPSHRPRRVVLLGDGKVSAHLHLHLIPEPGDRSPLDLGAVVADLNLNPRPNTLDDPATTAAVADLRRELA